MSVQNTLTALVLHFMFLHSHAASPTTCETPTIPNAEIVTDDYADYGEGKAGTVPTGDYVSIQCNHGYTSEAKTILFTCVNGTWSPKLPTCREVVTAPPVSKCQLPPLLYGTIRLGGKSPPEMVPVGSKITFTCYQGARLEGATDLTCKPDLQWNEAAPICTSLASNSCQIPRIEDSRIQMQDTDIYDLKIRVKPGEEMDIVCVPGFQRVGPRYLKCREDGTWNSKPPVCRVKIYQLGACFLPKVENAQYLNISLEDKEDIQSNGLNLEKYQNQSVITEDKDKMMIQISLGMIVAVRCNTDFELIGQRVIECNKSEPVAKFEWPKCQQPTEVKKEGSSSNTGTNRVLIIGISVTAGIVILLAVIIVGMIIWRRRQRPTRNDDPDNIHRQEREHLKGDPNGPTASV